MKDNVEGQKKGAYSGLMPGEQFLADIYTLVQAVKVYQEHTQLVLDGVENFRRSFAEVVGDQETLDLLGLGQYDVLIADIDGSGLDYINTGICRPQFSLNGRLNLSGEEDVKEVITHLTQNIFRYLID